MDETAHFDTHTVLKQYKVNPLPTFVNLCLYNEIPQCGLLLNARLLINFVIALLLTQEQSFF